MVSIEQRAAHLLLVIIHNTFRHLRADSSLKSCFDIFKARASHFYLNLPHLIPFRLIESAFETSAFKIRRTRHSISINFNILWWFAIANRIHSFEYCLVCVIEKFLIIVAYPAVCTTMLISYRYRIQQLSIPQICVRDVNLWQHVNLSPSTPVSTHRAITNRNKIKKVRLLNANTIFKAGRLKEI